MASKKGKRQMPRGCHICAERKRDKNGHVYCPHLKCPFETKELEWWQDVGGKTLIEVK